MVALSSKRKRLALPQQLDLISASMERSVSPLMAALVTVAGVMLTIALMSMPTARAARGVLDATPIAAAAGVGPQAATAAAAALAGGASQAVAGATAARRQAFDMPQVVASTAAVSADVPAEQAAVDATQLPAAAGGEQPHVHGAVDAAGAAAAYQVQPLPVETAVDVGGTAQDAAAASAAAGEPGAFLQDADAALDQQQAALAAEGAAAAAAAGAEGAAAAGVDPVQMQGAEAQQAVDPQLVAEQGAAAAAEPALPEEPLAPECSMAGVLRPDGGGCLCKLGAGGPSCGFSLATIFGSNEVYNLSPLRAFDLQGWSPTADFYHRLLEEVQAQTVVEVGVWKGLSATHMAQYLKDRGHGVLVAVDTWLGAPEFWNEAQIAGNDAERNLGLVNGYPSVYYNFISNVVHTGLQQAVIPLPLPSKVASVVLRKKALTADLVHVDAAHEYASVKEDIHIWWPFVRTGGILLGDDMNWIGVKKAVDEFSVVCEVPVAVEGVKWWIVRPADSWFEERPHLPSFCKIGEIGHYYGSM